jgi:nucleotide-binding universal stress UspA family protein
MKILLAVDGSKHSDWSTEFVAKLPLAESPEVHVVHVFDPDSLGQPVGIPSLALPFREYVIEETKNRLGRATELVSREARTLRASIRKVTTEVAQGHVAETILAIAKKRRANLIVLGTHGFNRFEAMLLGSVSHQVLSHAHCSVAIVKKKPRVMKRITLGIDGSPAARKAGRFVTEELDPKGLRATVVHAWDYPLTPYPMELIESSLYAKFAAPLRRRGLAVKLVLESGDAAAGLTAVAERDRADLVVVGSRGLSALKRFLLGAVSLKVATTAKTSVLVVR